MQNVKIIPSALAAEEGVATIYRESIGPNPSTWGNSIIPNIWGDADEQLQVQIKTTRLVNYIDDIVDFLKLDIEVCEEQVLRNIEPKLFMIRQLELEFHGTTTNQEINDLDRIVELLRRNSFEVETKIKDVATICREQTIKRVNPKFAQVKAKRSI